MAKSSISMVLLLASLVVFVLSNPLLNPYDNLPQCMQPQQSGLCLAYFPRYFYNPATDSCETFIYGGCNGNSNNFWSEEECLKACKGYKAATIEFKLVTESVAVEGKSAEQEPQQQQSTEDPCTLPVETGECRAAMPRLFYNAATSKCEQFLYGGCNGNANNFVTIEECQQRCESKSPEDANSASQDATKVDEPKAESVAENE